MTKMQPKLLKQDTVREKRAIFAFQRVKFPLLKSFLQQIEWSC